MKKLQGSTVTVVTLSLIVVLFLTQPPVGLARENAFTTEVSQNASFASVSERSPDELDALLEQDPDVQTLLQIRNSITQRVINRNISISALKAAFQAGDEEQIINLLQFFRIGNQRFELPLRQCAESNL
jgi:prephenate dehydrogenase